MGWYAGNGASKYAQMQSKFLPVSEKGAEEILKESCSKWVQSRGGDSWKEVELAVQNILDFYRGEVSSAPLLKRGLERLEDLRKNVSFRAPDPHELARCFEVSSIMDNAEMVLRASMERRESRKVPFGFFRADFPAQDDENYRCFMGLRKEGGGVKSVKIPILRKQG
jgi:succinate dehydrogenase/fumarate reductase flavoprotein subunit